MCEVKKCVKSFLRKVFCWKKCEDGEQGITLVEIIVGLTVVASIAAVVLTQVGGLFDRTQENEARGEITDIVNGIMAYISAGGSDANLGDVFVDGYTSVVKYDGSLTALVAGTDILSDNAYDALIELRSLTEIDYTTAGNDECARLELYFKELKESLSPIDILECGGTGKGGGSSDGKVFVIGVN